jgi:hypothetical protein
MLGQPLEVEGQVGLQEDADRHLDARVQSDNERLKKQAEADEDLAAAREEARKWEFVATHEETSTRRPPEPYKLLDRDPNIVDALLARYQPAEEETP